MATCNIQSLLDANPCYGSLEPMDLALLEYGLLCAIKEKIDGGSTASCSVQDLLTSTTCARTLYPTPLDALSAQLALDIAGYVGIPTLDPCLASLSPWFLSLVITQLYCTIADILDGGPVLETCDIQTLLNQATCFNTVEPVILSRLRVSLLCQIYTTIVDPPDPPTCTLSITTNPSNFTGTQGDDFSLTVAWSGAIGAGQVQWQRDDGGAGWIDVSDGEFDGTVATGSTTPTLTITNAGTFTTGTYRAIVTDPALTSCTATSTSATVTINAATGNHLLPGLVAYYRFEEKTGNAFDTSGNNHTLVEQGTVLATPTGIVQRARSYDQDTQSYFRNSSGAFTNLTALTITVWARFETGGVGANDMTVIAKGSYPGGTLAWWLILDHATPNDLITFYYTTDGVTLQSLIYNLNGSVDANTFYFLAVRWSGTLLTLSATTQGETSPTSPVGVAFTGPFYNTPDPLVIGTMPSDLSHAMNGTIDELALYNRALTDCELAWLFTAKGGTFTYPDFNSGTCA